MGETDATLASPYTAAEMAVLVYEDLRRLAVSRLKTESPGQTLQATALVHEVFLRLYQEGDEAKWASHRHFFAAAAESMRRILVDRARKKKAIKHGGDRSITAEGTEVALSAADEEVLALHEALARLEEVDPQAARLVQLRYFGGCTMSEAAEQLEISPRSADRLWAYARAWLRTAF